MIFDMKTEQNFASFYDEKNKIYIVIDSFDNKEFNIRIGKISKTDFICSFIAESDASLNASIKNAFYKYKENKDFSI